MITILVSGTSEHIESTARNRHFHRLVTVAADNATEAQQAAAP